MSGSEHRPLFETVSPAESWLCIHEMFEEQALRRPDAIAVTCGDTHLTYGTLDRLSNRLARLLRTHGVGPEVLVGLCVDRSVQLAVGILGILKAGGAYVPLDPAYPAARLRMMSQDADLKIIVTQDSYTRHTRQAGIRYICLDTDWVVLEQLDDAPLERLVRPEHLIYVFYTSGSTGRPKGVMITHANTAYFAGTVAQALGLQPDDVYLQSASITYALHFRQVMVPLSQGARVVIATGGEVRDPLAMLRLIRREGVTTVDFVPSYLRRCIQALSVLDFKDRNELLENNLRQIVTVGEALLSDLPRIWKQDFKHPARLLNIIGQTETTGMVATYPVPDGLEGDVRVVPVGWPVPGVTIHLLDEDLRPVPDEEAGELCVASPGLARGYLNRPGLTDEKFILSPFSEQAGARLLRTGDLARRRADGCLEFLGRKDFQVQIRGMRVELGEVEGALRQQSAVREAAVIAREAGPNETMLIACIVAEPGHMPRADTLRESLRTLLPEHMVPAAFRLLDALPYLPNGKVNRKALSVLEDRVAAATAEPLKKEPDSSDWTYLPSWQRTAPATLLPGQATGGPWMVFLDEYGIGQKIVACLREKGVAVTKVVMGEAFARQEDHAFTIHPTLVEDYNALFNLLEAEEQMPAAILHLWNVSDEASQEIAFGSVLRLAQALAARQHQKLVHLAIAADGLFDVTGGELLQPEKALLLGLCRSIPLEYPHIRCAAIDVGSAASMRLPAALLAEMEAGLPEAEVVYRGGHRWRLQYESVRLPWQRPQDIPLRDEGVYLLTGGLGGVGLALADALARNTRQPRLILTGRSTFPDREDWDKWLVEEDASDKTSRQIRAIQALEAQEAIVQIAQADVTDARQMRALVDQMQAEFGGVHGAVHAAGLTNAFRMIPFLSLEQSAMVIAPKVQGTRVLLDVLRDEDLDFVVLCSSISAVLGRLEQSDYCAANAAQDMLARSYRRQGMPVLSVNWDTWQEEGVAAETAVQYHLKEVKGEEIAQGLLSDEGKDVFLQTLGVIRYGVAQLIISTRDLPRRLEVTSVAQSQADLSRPIQYEPLHAGSRQPYVAPCDEVERRLVEIWEDILGVEGMGVHDHFFDCGGHSLRGMQVMARIFEEWGLTFTVRTLFETPTIAGFAERIRQQQEQPREDEMTVLLAELDALSDDEARELLGQPANREEG